ncbi:MAG: hypothetical protein ACFFKA_00030 [Candidatus Thorarchaeota archaeon]
MIHNFSEWHQLNEQANKYKVSGTKFEMFGSFRVDIKAVNLETGEIVISKGGEGNSEEIAYNTAAKAFNIEAAKLGLKAPTKEELVEE